MTTRFPVCTRGSTYRHTLPPIYFTSGSLTDCVIRMMVKLKNSDADADALISIDNDEIGGVTVISATSPAVIEIEIPDDMTADLPAPKRLFAGIQIELADGTTEEIEGIDQDFLVKADAVRAVASP